MDEASRLNRRSRPRPYDLRRKVLLKNFFREQMTFVPLPRETRDSSNENSNDTNFVPDSSSVNESENLLESNNENESVMLSSDENYLQPSNQSEASVVASDVINDETSSKSKENFAEPNIIKPKISKFSRFSSLMRLRSMSPKKIKNKGIFKAKHVCTNVKSPVKSKPLRRNFDKLSKNIKYTDKCKSSFRTKSSSHEFSEAGTSEKRSRKSLLSLFKSFKNSKNINKKDAVVDSLSKNSTSCSTSSQSVQTDLSWSVDEVNDVEETNRLLLEENKLLSQSLSYFMSNTSKADSLPYKQDTIFESPFIHRNKNADIFLSYENHNHLPKDSYDVPNIVPNKRPQIKILRSKSVRQHSDRKMNKCHRAKSMNYPPLRDSLRSSKVSSLNSFSSPNVSAADIDYRKLRFPCAKSAVLKNLSNSSGRTIYRRSSMPERTNAENIRSAICRRTGSMHSHDRRRPAIPFHALPAEAFY